MSTFFESGNLGWEDNVDFIKNFSELCNNSTVIVYSKLRPAGIREKPTACLAGCLGKVGSLEPVEITESLQSFGGMNQDTYFSNLI